jgi:hypothetical protein
MVSGDAGYMLEVLSGRDIRQGLQLTREFLASGHTSADKALQTYLASGEYVFPPHEIFKGAVLGKRKYYREVASRSAASKPSRIDRGARTGTPTSCPIRSNARS